MYAHWYMYMYSKCNVQRIPKYRIYNVYTDHHPAGTKENDHAEDVDHAGREDAIPRTEQDGLRDEEVGFVPWLAIG